MGFSSPNHRFASCLQYAGVEGWCPCPLSSLELGVRVALNRNWLCQLETDDLWNALTLNGRAMSLIRGPHTLMINEWEMPFQLPRR